MSFALLAALANSAEEVENVKKIEQGHDEAD